MVNFLRLQETHMSRVELLKQNLCGEIPRMSLLVILQREILSIWDPLVFKEERVQCNENVVIVEGYWIRKNIKCTLLMCMLLKRLERNEMFGGIFLWS